MNKLSIRHLFSWDADDLSRLLKSQPKDYMKGFRPFDFDSQSIKTLLKKAVKDRYFGLELNRKIIGFFMLRGFDQGYKIPAFGVFVAKHYSRKGLLKLSLQFADTWCRLNKVKRMMLHVDPDNVVAKKTYKKFGFHFERLEESSQMRYVKSTG